MAQRMLIDASAPGEIRMALVDGNQLVDYDFEDASKRQVKSSIFLAQVTRVEPSLQAAFLEYGALRQGFLALPEIHPDYYKIPVADREKLNEALKQSAAEVQAEIDNMVEDNGATGNSEFQDPRDAEQPSMDLQEHADPSESPAMLSSFGRAELISALSEFIGPKTPDNYIPVVNNFALSDDIAAQLGTSQDDSGDEDEEDDGQQSGDRRGGRGRQWRGRHGNWRQRREQLDPEAMEAARRRQLLRSYKIQEVIKRRQVMLVQVNKEERGTKGAALTTYISLPGRYCVLMPNSSNAGGVSRKITNPNDRRRMKELMSALKVPDGMGVILRTAGLECTPEEIARDLDYLLRLWDNICALTLKSTAPALIYEEGDLITRSIRDLYNDDISEIIVSGQTGYDSARSFMDMLLPQHVGQVKLYGERMPLFTRYRVDEQIDAVHEPVVQLPSGGYIVINQTEALVAIDVNSGRATRERNIEETAYRTNLEAAAEVARQLRLRDLAGLIVVDFIDMEDHRHRIGVERRMRDAMKIDRARTQIGRISTFGLLELSRQRLRPSVVDAHFARCETCAGTGWVRSVASSARGVLRAIEQELAKGSLERLTVTVHSKLALQLLNQFRMQIIELEERTHTNIMIDTDDTLTPPNCRFERHRGSRGTVVAPPVNEAVNMRGSMTDANDNDDGFTSGLPENTYVPSVIAEESFDAPNGANRQDRGGRRQYRGRGSNAGDNARGQFDAPQQAFDGGVGDHHDHPAAFAADDVTPVPAPQGTEFGVRPGRGPRRGRGPGLRRGGRNGYNDAPAQPHLAGSEQPSVSPEAFTHHKQDEWNANKPIATAPAVTQPETAPAAPAPISTAPVVTQIASTGEAAPIEGEGTSRKGWWNKLMKA